MAKDKGKPKTKGADGVSSSYALAAREPEPSVMDAFKAIGELLEAYKPDEQRRILEALVVCFGFDRPPVGKAPPEGTTIEEIVTKFPRTLREAREAPFPIRGPHPTAIY